MIKKRVFRVKNKRAISLIVSYVLLISISFMLAGLVYAWLKNYASKPVADESCPNGLSLLLHSYTFREAGAIEITVQNKGFFKIDGFMIKMNDKAEGIPGKYPLCLKDTSCTNEIIFKNEAGASEPLMPNLIYKAQFDYDPDNTGRIISQIEITPIRNGTYCEAKVVSQQIVMSTPSP